MIVSQLSPPKIPQLSGMAERRNQILFGMVRSIMSRATLLISLWGYSLEITSHILNLIPSNIVSKTPYQIWSEKYPSLAHVKVCNCEVFVRHKANDKLEPKSEKCYFVGYP